MYKKLLNGFMLTLLLSACGGATPHFTVVCEEDSVGYSSVKWESTPALEGRVKVYASTNPDHIPENIPVASANIADQRVTVASKDSLKRYYFTLLFNDRYRVRVASRNVRVPGVQNFRDLGGYPIYPRHQHVRWGMLYRSAQIDLSQPATMKKLQALGIRTIIDLRDSSECTPHTQPTGTGIRQLHIPIQAGNLQRILKGIDTKSISSDTVYRIVERLNRNIVRRNAAEFRHVFNTLMDQRNYPIVIHCTSGKGRTGIASALVLAALGVDDEVIMDDYRLSNSFFDIPTASSYAYHLPAPSQEALTTIYSARENFLNAAKDEIERRYGSVSNYLQYAIGLQKNDLKQLRSILLVKDEE